MLGGQEAGAEAAVRVRAKKTSGGSDDLMRTQVDKKTSLGVVKISGSVPMYYTISIGSFALKKVLQTITTRTQMNNIYEINYNRLLASAAFA
jgi:hypothetical protein